ncbi:MAG: germination protein YpeB [Clostridiales bacterium]|nr:germination protein YpeB [Clostridiales bacterium]MCF8022519.1 germination protein YpeB [Clostridiales bacterium]
MKKWVAFLVVGLVAIGGIGYWGYTQYTTLQRAEVALANNYNRAFYNTLEHVQNLEVLLSKGMVSADKMQNSKIFTELRNQASAGLDSLTQLPIRDITAARTAKFFTQLGDFSQQMAEKVENGKTLTEKQSKLMQKLYTQAGELNEELQEVESKVTDGDIDFTEMSRKTSRQLNKEGKRLEGPNFQTIDSKMQEYPTLIYDGPFSDHLADRDPEALKNKKKITSNKAKDTAEDFFKGEKNNDFVAQVTGEIGGNIPAYRVQLTPRKNGKVVGQQTMVDVSKKGGEMIWILNPRDIDKSKISIDKAKEETKKFLSSHGYDNMKSSYYQRQGNMVIFNFIGKKGDTVIYPDMMKITVALDNGEVVALDNRSYLMNHHERDLPEPKLTREEAKELLAGGIEVDGKGRLAVIPTETFEEKLTWEFKGKKNDNTFLIYINAMNGQEQKILQLLRTKNGTLTM